MERTFEYELDFLKEGVEQGIDTDAYAANVFLERQLNLLEIVIQASVKEMEEIMSSMSSIEARATNQGFNDLSIMSEIATRQHQILTVLHASSIATVNMIGHEEDEYPSMFKQMGDLIERHPDLLEKKATERSLQANDTSSKTALIRHHLNSLLEDS